MISEGRATIDDQHDGRRENSGGGAALYIFSRCSRNDRVVLCYHYADIGIAVTRDVGTVVMRDVRVAVVRDVCDTDIDRLTKLCARQTLYSI